jgi:hypothetical protein
VQQQRGRLGAIRLRLRIRHHRLVQHQELRLVHDDARDGYPAAFDAELGLAARAGGQFNQASGQSDRLGYVGDRQERAAS